MFPVGEYGFPFRVGRVAWRIVPGVVDAVGVQVVEGGVDGEPDQGFTRLGRGVVVPARMRSISRWLSPVCSAIRRALMLARAGMTRSVKASLELS